jgi:hypothetical protein
MKSTILPDSIVKPVPHEIITHITDVIISTRKSPTDADILAGVLYAREQDAALRCMGGLCQQNNQVEIVY